MLTTSFSFSAKDLERNPQREKWWLFGFFALYWFLELYNAWVFPNMWDDDGPNRYFHLLSAIRNPETFVSLWDRPLFVWLFFIPSHFGPYAIPALLPLVVILGARAVYLGLKELNVPNAIVFVPLYLFQLYLFGISRSALTEPLAATVIAYGFLFAVRRQWTAFALAGALLPLARLELIVLWPLWAWALWQNGAVKRIPLLLTGIAAWSLLAALITGDLLYIFSQTLLRDAAPNPYPHQPPQHYVMRAHIVFSPPVWFFGIIGMAHLLYKKHIHPFLLPHFVLGFLLYTVLAWQVDMGNPAGFLRNLVPLAPLAALLALEGINAFVQAFAGKLSGASFLLPAVVGAALTLTAWVVFPVKQMRSIDVFIALPYMTAGVVTLLLCSGLLIRLFRNNLRAASVIPAALSLAGCLFFLEFAIPPDRLPLPERENMAVVAEIWNHSSLSKFKTFASHPRFYWSAGTRPDDSRFSPLLLASLEQSAPGAVVIWETHYSTRLGSDVPYSSLSKSPEYHELFSVVGEDNSTVCIFQKTGLNAREGMAMVEAFVKENPGEYTAWASRAAYRATRFGDFKGSAEDLLKAIALHPGDSALVFTLGYAYISGKEWTKAEEVYAAITAQKPNNADAWTNLAAAKLELNKPAEAIDAYSRVIQIRPAPEIFTKRAGLRAYLNDTAAAFSDLAEALRLDAQHAPAICRRAAIYAASGDHASALKDYEEAIRLMPTHAESWYLRGKSLEAAGDKVSAAASFHKADSLGYQKKPDAESGSAPEQP